jgi:Skp family chaperone for outer membrane proteins
LDPPKPAGALTELQKKAQSVAPVNVNRFVAPSHPARAEAEKLVNEFNAKYSGINKPVLTDPAALDKKIADYEQLQKDLNAAKDNSAAKQKAEFEKQFASPDDAAAFGVIANVVSGDHQPHAIRQHGEGRLAR